MEFVLVVERAKLFLDEAPHGFTPIDEVDRFVNSAMFEKAFFVEREVAEHRPDWKQIIPYVLLQREDGAVWVMRRGKTGDEERLHDSYYVGVGGHVNPVDCVGGRPVFYTITKAMTRELEEEADIRSPDGVQVPFCDVALDMLGMVNDDTNDVGAVHLGLVYRIRLRQDTEIETEDAGFWCEKQDIHALSTGAYETWTQLILEGADL